MIDTLCRECGEPAIEQDKYDDDLCENDFSEALEWDAADNAIKYAKENTWGWKT